MLASLQLMLMLIRSTTYLPALQIANKELLNLNPNLTPILNEKLQKEVKKLSEKKLTEFLQGVDLYRRYLQDYQGEERLDGKVIWQSGSVSLIDYNEELSGEYTVFLIPSLINKSYIFDISPEKSFIRFLKKQGVNVFLIDWGEPTELEHDFNCTDYIEKRLLPAFAALRNKVSENKNSKIIPVGYCLGGMFAMALAQLKKDEVDGLALLATPWDFSTDELWHFSDTEMLSNMLNCYKILPPFALQYIFMLMNIETIEEKFRKLYMCKDVSGFMAIEGWLNDGVSITVPAAKELFIDLVHENKAYKGEWIVCGEVIQPEKIETPTLIVVPKKDKIVPASCSGILSERLPNNTLLENNSGHIGMLIGNKARAELWKPFADWLKKAL